MTIFERLAKINEQHKAIQLLMDETRCDYNRLALDSKPDADEAYERGLNEAWEAAKKIVDIPIRGGLTRMELEELFGCGDCRIAMQQNTASEALAKLRDYEEKKKAEDEAVKVGDEVTDGKFVGVVTRIESTALYVVMSDGSSSAWGFGDGWRKTGNHFPEIAAVLEQMKGE